MSSQIVLNSSHYDENQGAFVYRFPIQQKFAKGDRIALTNVNVFNSFYNANAEEGKNQIKIKWPSGTGYITKKITIADGFYTSDTFSLYLTKVCMDEKFYTTATDGSILVYLSTGNSETQYKSYIKSFLVKTSVVRPAGATWTAPTSNRSPMISFGKLGPLFGFPSDPTMTIYYGENLVEESLTTYSTITPQVNPFNSIIMTCNLVHNSGLSFPTNFIYSLGINASFGSMISSPAHEPLYNELIVGHHTEIIITLHDNTLQRLKLLDTNALLLISIISSSK